MGFSPRLVSTRPGESRAAEISIGRVEGRGGKERRKGRGGTRMEGDRLSVLYVGGSGI
jgi:hypothetical protein